MSSDLASSAIGANPFVGPRSFGPEDRLYGRDREAEDLLDLLVAERVVVLHSPSGAGKTSLIQARLLPRLEEDGFGVLPVIRTAQEIPSEAGRTGAPNRYVLSTLSSLEEGLPADRQRPVGTLVGLNLADYVAGLSERREHAGKRVLVFDQFEEVITTDPTDLPAKRQFFAQVGAALRDRGIWALFALREDFLAELEPYARLVPTRFATRYRLDLLTVDAALEAMTRPAQDAGVLFHERAARRLVDDLRRVRVQRPGGPVEALGPHAEPVQLQVVCHRLWDRLAPGARSIDVADLESVGDVDRALALYYADCVGRTVRETGVRERALREWFEQELVTPQGFRGQVLHGPSRAGPAASVVLTTLTGAHLLRAESRRGATWYELAHDRLVEPVRQDNARWREEHLSDIERRAAWWEEQGRPDHLLLADVELAAAEVEAWDAGEDLAERERDFLAASRLAVEQAERERRANRRTRRWLVVAIIGCLLALTAFGVAAWSLIEATSARLRAAEAGLVQAAGQRLGEDADLALLLGLRAASLAGATVEPGAGVQDFFQEALTTIPVVQVLREGGPATAVAYSDDGRLIVTGHRDGPVRIRDDTTGEQVRVLTPAGYVNAVDFGPGENGQALVVSAGRGGTVQVWGPESDVPVSLSRPPSDVLGIAVGPDGNAIASARADGSVVVARTATGEVLHELRRPGATAAVNDVDWTPDGLRLVAVDDDGVVAFWDAQTGGLLHEERGHSGKAQAVAALDAARVVTGGLDRSAVIWDVARGIEAIRLPARGPVTDVSASRTGERLLVVDIAGNLAVVDSSTGRTLRTVTGNGARPLAAQLDPVEPGRAAVATWNGTAALWDVAVGHVSPPVALDGAADGTTVTGTEDDGTVRFWASDGSERGTLTTGAAGVRDMAMSGDGRRLVLADTSGMASVWDLDEPVRTLTLPAQGVASVSMSANGRLVATGSASEVAVWDAGDGTRIRVLELPGGPARALDFAPAADQLAGASAGGIAVIWGLGDGRPRHKLLLEGLPNTMAWSPDGDTVAVAGESAATQVWDAETGELRTRLPGHSARVNDVAFDTSGARLATVGDDGEINVWDASDGALLVRRHHPAWVYRVAFTPDGAHLLATSTRGAPFVVYLIGREMVETAQARTTRGMTAGECIQFVQPFTDCSQER